MSKMRDMLRITGAGSKEDRSPQDYYVTPPIAVEELLKRETFEGQGWEPACGNGAISKFFPGIMASDIRHDDIAGESGVDFFSQYREVDFIVTNPPFKYALEFIEHSLVCANKVAILARLQLLEGKRRYWFYQKHPPIRIYVFSNRISCAKGGMQNGSYSVMCFAWFIWERGFRGNPAIDWILHEGKSDLFG